MENAKQNPSVVKNQGSDVYGNFGTYTTGVAAAAATAFLKLASIFNEISNEFGNLFVKQAQFQQTAANSSAEATVENAKDTALSTIFNGIGDFIGAAGQLAGCAASFKAYYGSLPEDSNLDLAKEYQEACEPSEGGLAEKGGSPQEIKMEDFANRTTPEEETEEQKQLEKRVEELTEIEDVQKDLLSGNKGPLSDEEKLAVQTMDNRDQATFKAKIDEYVSKQTEAQNAALKGAVDKAQVWNNFWQAVGKAGGAVGGNIGSAAYQYKGGKEQAKVTLANEALQLAQNSAEQERNKADSFQQTASSEFDKLTQIRQAETSSQG